MAQSELVLSMVLAACGGSLTCMAVNVGPCVKHFAARRGKMLGRHAAHAINAGYFALVSIGGGICILSTYYGPVAVTMPSNASASLLVNMLIQGGLGIKHYTRTMEIGTLILVAVSISLGEVGPKDHENIKEMSPADILLERPIGAATLALTCIAVMVCAAATQICKGQRQMLKLLLVAFVSANSTSAAWSLQKLLVMSPLGPTFAMFLVLWLIAAFFSIASGAQAGWHCDLAIYYPVSKCMQFVSNGLLGIVVWGDADRMRAPVAYAMALLLSCAGACLTCSSEARSDSMVQQSGCSTAKASGDGETCTIAKEHSPPRDLTIATADSVQTPSTATSSHQVLPLGTLMFMQSMSDVESTWSMSLEDLEEPESIGARLEAALQQGFNAGCVDTASLLRLCGSLGGALARREACQDVERGSALLESWYIDRVPSQSSVSESSSPAQDERRESKDGVADTHCFGV